MAAPPRRIRRERVALGDVMTEIEIVGNPRSTYTRMVRMACEEKGAPYTFKEGLPHTPPVDAIHPFDVAATHHRDLAERMDRIDRWRVR